jgi:hypothetical protein
MHSLQRHSEQHLAQRDDAASESRVHVGMSQDDNDDDSVADHQEQNKDTSRNALSQTAEAGHDIVEVDSGRSLVQHADEQLGGKREDVIASSGHGGQLSGSLSHHANESALRNLEHASFEAEMGVQEDQAHALANHATCLPANQGSFNSDELDQVEEISCAQDTIHDSTSHTHADESANEALSQASRIRRAEAYTPNHSTALVSSPASLHSSAESQHQHMNQDMNRPECLSAKSSEYTSASVTDMKRDDNVNDNITVSYRQVDGEASLNNPDDVELKSTLGDSVHSAEGKTDWKDVAIKAKSKLVHRLSEGLSFTDYDVEVCICPSRMCYLRCVLIHFDPFQGKHMHCMCAVVLPEARRVYLFPLSDHKMLFPIGIFVGRRSEWNMRAWVHVFGLS